MNPYMEPTEPEDPASSLDVLQAYGSEAWRRFNMASGTINLGEAYADYIDKAEKLTGKKLRNPEYYGVDADPEIRQKYWSDWNQYREDGGQLSGSVYRRMWQEREFRRQIDDFVKAHPDLKDQLTPPDQSFESQGRQKATDASEAAQETWMRSRQGWLDSMSSTAGSFGGAMGDPINLITMGFGFGGVGTGIKGIWTGFLKAGIANATVEGMVQPIVKGYNNQLGTPYGWGDVGISLGSAFLLGGGVDAAVRGTYRGLAGRFGYAPITNSDGYVVAWRRKVPSLGGTPSLEAELKPLSDIPTDLMQRAQQGDPAAIADIANRLTEAQKATGETVIPHTTMQQAAEGDMGSLRQVAEPEAKADPVVKMMLDAAEADERLLVAPDPKIPEADHAATMAQTLRHVDEPDLEPLPVRTETVDVAPEIVPKLEAEIRELRAKAETPDAETQARIDELEAQIRRIDTFGRDPVQDAMMIREGAFQITNDVDLGNPGVRQARSLAALSDEAFAQVSKGEAAPELGALVADHAVPELHGRLLSDLTARQPVSLDDAKAQLVEILGSPDYRPHVEDVQGPVAQSAKSPRQLDDPTGPEAKAQVQRLEQDLREELAAGGREPPPMEEMLADPQTREVLISRADEVRTAIAQMADIVPPGTEVRVFDSIDMLPSNIRASVRAANGKAFAAAVEAFQGAKSVAERHKARQALDAASRQQGVEGIAADGVIWIASYAMNPRARIAHEVVHALRTSGRLSPDEVRILATAARDLDVFHSDLEAMYRADLEGRVANVDAILEEEAAAHMIDAVVRGEVPAGRVVEPQVASVVDRIKEFFAKVRSALIGKGFVSPETVPVRRPEQDVIATLLSGEMAKRETRADWMRDNVIKDWAQITESKVNGDGSVLLAMRHSDEKTGQSMRADLDRLGYFSGALEAAKRLRQAKGTPEQMLAMLQKEGAKKAEIEATGLDKFILGRETDAGAAGDRGPSATGAASAEGRTAGQRAPNVSRNQITKSEIIKYLEDNRVEVREVERGLTQEQLAAEARMNELRDQMRAIQRDDYQRTGGFRDEKALAADNPEYAALVAEYDALSARNFGPDRKANEPTKWQPYSLDPNNPTYRETVLHLPSRNRQTFQEYLDAYRQRFGDNGQSDADVRRFYNEGHLVPDQGETLSRNELDFRSGHFPEPNIVGHMMTSMVKHEGKATYLIDQIQSDWGQKLRDGGVRDEAKIADLEKQIKEYGDKWSNNSDVKRIQAEAESLAKEAYPDGMLPAGQNRSVGALNLPARRMSNAREGIMALAADATKPEALREKASDLRLQWREVDGMYEPTLNRLRAELRTAEAATPGHPLVNTTDQWTNTTLRRAIRQAAEADAEYIAIPHGDTVLSYNPGDMKGMREFYGSGRVRDEARLAAAKAEHEQIKGRIQELDEQARKVPRNSYNRTQIDNEKFALNKRMRELSDTIGEEISRSEKPIGIVPKNLRNLLQKLDKDSPDPITVKELETTSGNRSYNPDEKGTFKEELTGFTLFPLTDKVKQTVKEQGQPLFAMRGLDMSPEARKARAEEMGFDTSRVWYHGTEKGGFRSFDDAMSGKSSGHARQVGIFFTESRLNASTYSGAHQSVEAAISDLEDFDPRYDGERGIYSVYIRPGKQKVVDWEGGNWDEGPMGWNVPYETHMAKEQGYDSLRIINVIDEGRYGQGYGWGNETLVVFDPSNIRSVNAAFDPSEAGSANLMFALRDLSRRLDAPLVDDLGKSDPHPGRVMAVHGTKAQPFDQFDPAKSADFGIHFGTKDQADIPAGYTTTRENARMIPVVLDLKTVVDVPDMMTWPPVEVAAAVEKAYPLARGLEDRVRAVIAAGSTETGPTGSVRPSREALDAGKAELRRLMSEAKIDGLRYWNDSEGEGWSYIVWDEGKVSSATSGEPMMGVKPDGQPLFALRGNGEDIPARVAEQPEQPTSRTDPEVIARITDAMSSVAGDPAELAARLTPQIMETAQAYGISPDMVSGLAARVADQVGSGTDLTEALTRQLQDAMPDQAQASQPLYGMMDAKGRVKPGAQKRAEDLAADLAEIEAELKGANIDDREALQRKRASLLNAKAVDKVLDDARAYRSARGEEDPAKGLMHLIESEGVHGGAMDLVTLKNIIQGKALSMMDELVWEFRKGAFWGDWRRTMNTAVRTRMENVIREAAGEKTSDPLAASMGKAWLEVAEYLRQRFNAAGGDIGKLKGWFAPQYHDVDALVKAGRQVWVDYMMKDGVLDWERMAKADGSQLTVAERRDLLRDIWRTITTDGAEKREVTGFAGKGAMYKRHADHRVLHFKNADAYLKYTKEFGSGDVYAMMIGHINVMSRDIAAMERFGANPDVVLERVRQQLRIDAELAQTPRSMFDDLTDLVAEIKGFKSDAIKTRIDTTLTNLSKAYDKLDRIKRKSALRGAVSEQQAKLIAEIANAHMALNDLMVSGDMQPRALVLAERIVAMQDQMLETATRYSVKSKDPVERANTYLRRGEEMWKLYKGSTNVPGNSRAADAMQGFRNWTSASILVKASISAISDQAIGMAARAFIGMPVHKQLTSFIKGFTKADRKAALRLRVGLDPAMTAFSTQSRYAGYVNTRQFTGYIADRTHAFSGLSPMTQAAKVGFSSDFMAWMADLAATTPYQKLDRWVQQMLERHRISADDWAALRTVTPDMDRGVAKLSSEAIERDVGEDLAEKYMAALFRERAMAVIDPTLRGRTAFISETKPGTVIGEMSRSVAMVKSFPTSYATLVLGRLYNQIASGRGMDTNTIAYGTAILFLGMAFGGLAIQLKDITSGADPQDMTEPDFWAKAFLQSGGAGIFGDFIASSVNRHGNGLATTLMGPLADRGSMVLDATVGNLVQYAKDEKTNTGREMARLMRSMTPGAFVPFYLRAAYERAVIDEIQKQIDPDSYRSFRSRIRSKKKFSGNEYFWPPGSPMPERGPRLDRAFGGDGMQ
jgi:hypothetical protein